MTTSLTKQSSESEIKNYFAHILKLSQTDEKFPVDLDEVWMLVYADRSKATRALKTNFIENEDFILLAQNGKQDWGGHNRLNYHLSVSCLEYFIARKVRPVFDVYRQVFHKVAQQKVLSPAEQALYQAQLLVEQEKRMTAIESDVKVIKAQVTTRPDYFTIVGYATLHGVKCGLKLASSLGIKASRLCKDKGIITETIPDPRFGTVKTYPESILSEVFNANVAV